MTAPPAPLPPGLLALAPFDVDAARRHGIGADRLRAGVRSGELQAVRRGWYAPTGPHGPADEDARFVARSLAAHRSLGLALTGASSLAVQGLPVYDVRDRPVHLVGDPGRRRSRGTDLVTTPLLGGPMLVPDGSRADTLDSVLAAALVDPGLALAAADVAVRTGLLTTAQVVDGVGRLGRRRGAAAARTALGLVDPRRESVGESRLALLCHGFGIPLVPQVPVRVGGRTLYPDFVVEGTRVLLEFDGRLKYADEAALFAEKRREDALREHGFVVVRVVWADLYRPESLLARLRAAMASAA